MWGFWELLRPIAVLLFVYISGLLLVQWALSEASRLTRLSVAAGISPILLGWLLVVESLLGIKVSNFTVIGGLLVMDLFLVGMVLWRNPQGVRRPWSRSRIKARRVWRRLKTLTLADRQTSLSNVTMLLVAIVLVPLAATYMTRLQKEEFTEFLLVEQEPNIALWRRAVPLDEVLPVEIEIRSTERAAADFSVRMSTLDTVVGQMELGTIQPGQRLVKTVSLPPRVEKVQRFMLTLHMDEDVSPYRTLFFWVSTSVER